MGVQRAEPVHVGVGNVQLLIELNQRGGNGVLVALCERNGFHLVVNQLLTVGQRLSDVFVDGVDHERRQSPGSGARKVVIEVL